MLLSKGPYLSFLLFYSIDQATATLRYIKIYKTLTPPPVLQQYLIR